MEITRSAFGRRGNKREGPIDSLAKMGWGLRMRGYSDDGDVALIGSITPEYPVSGGGILLRVSLENLFAVRTYQARIFVGLESGVVGIEKGRRRFRSVSLY